MGWNAGDLPTGVVTFFMTDVVGSTRLAETDPARYLRELSHHDTIVSDAVSGCGGHFLKHRGEGDSTFSVFGRPQDAVQAGILVVQRLAQDLPELKIRLAVHSGPAENLEMDYRGDAVNRCARIRSICAPGQFLLSESSYSLCESRPESRDLGLHLLKDLRREIRLYQVDIPGQSGEFPRLITLAQSPNNLQEELTSFVGREQEMNQLIALIQKSRLVTLLGPGGVGKSRLAHHTGAELIDFFSDGVWFVELLGSDTEGAMTRILQTLKLSQSGYASAEEALTLQLRNKRVLLVLDNCEHLDQQFSAFVARLLHQTSHVHVLATSQSVLDLLEEQVFPVLPLQTAGEESPAVQLMLDRLSSKGGVGMVSKSDIETIVNALGGMPLAIELIAPRLRNFSAKKIIERLDHFLAEDNARVETRHKSIRACLQYSIEMLSDEERLMLGRMGSVPDSFNFDLVEQALCCDPLKEIDASRLLTNLSNRSLVDVYLRKGEFRYRILPHLRPFVREFLSGDQAQTGEALRKFSLKLCEEFSFGETTLDEFRGEQTLLEWALESCLSLNHTSEALHLAKAIRKIWIHDGDSRAGCSAYSRLLTKPEELSPSDLADALNAHGIFLWFAGRNVEAAESFDGAITVWRELGLQTRIAAALNNVGMLKKNLGEYQSAYDLWSESHALFKAHGPEEHVETTRLNALTAKLHMDYEGTKALFLDEINGGQLSEDDYRMMVSNLFGRANIEGDRELAARLLVTVVDDFEDSDPLVQSHSLLHLGSFCIQEMPIHAQAIFRVMTELGMGSTMRRYGSDIDHFKRLTILKPSPESNQLNLEAIFGELRTRYSSDLVKF